MEMMSLYDLMNIELNKLQLQEKYQKLDDFITNDIKCIDFIYYLISNYEIEFFNNIFDTDNRKKNFLTQNRAKHSVITFLMGKVFSCFCNVYDGIAQTIHLSKEYNDIIWMLASLYHDVGYFYPSLLGDKNIILKDKFQNYLLSDENKYDQGFFNKYPNIFAYSYSEIEAYDLYAREYHLRNNSSTINEIVDHGILGGCIVFDRIYKRLNTDSSDNEYFKIIKAACLTIAQHNIFKSGSKQDDYYYPKELLYKLSYASTFKISKDYPILYLLSLVDTIEIIKRYGGDETDKILKKKIHTITLLKNFLVKVDYNKLEIDFRNINSKIISAGVFENFIMGYENSIYSMGKWLDVRVNKQGSLFTIYKKNV